MHVFVNLCVLVCVLQTAPHQPPVPVRTVWRGLQTQEGAGPALPLSPRSEFHAQLSTDLSPPYLYCQQQLQHIPVIWAGAFVFLFLCVIESLPFLLQSLCATFCILSSLSVFFPRLDFVFDLYFYLFVQMCDGIQED